MSLKCGIVGLPNVGKSTLTNRLLGEDRVVVADHPGTTRDSIYIPLERDGKKYIVIDTAGVRKRRKVSEDIEKFSIVKTLKAIEDCNVALLVIDARSHVTDQDLSLLGFILESGRSLVIAVNKWDGLDVSVKDEIKLELNNDAINNGGDIRFHLDSDVNVNNCTFKGSRSNLNGGSIQANIVSNIKISYSNFTNCYSAQKGGAINWDDGDNFNIFASIFQNCTSGNDKKNILASKLSEGYFDEIIFLSRKWILAVL